MTHHFQVQGMQCGHCEQTILQALKRLDPQADVRIDRLNARLEVDSTCSREQLAKVIQDEGYTVCT